MIAAGDNRVVEAQADLILVHRLVGGAAIVVGRASARGQRIPPEQSAGDRIQPRERNRIPRKHGACRNAVRAGGGGSGIEDRGHPPRNRLGEDALPLQHGGHRGDDGAANRLSLALIVGKEECAVAANGTAEHATVLIAPEARVHALSGRKHGAGREGFVPEELERRAPQRAGAGLGRDLHDAAVEAAVLGRRAVALDGDLLNRVGVGEECHLARLRLENRDAIEQILIRARPPAVDAWQRRTRRKRHARGEAGKRDDVASVERQCDGHAAVDHLAEGRCVTPLQGFGRDRHGLGHAVGLELQFDVDGPAGNDGDAVAHRGPEAVQLGADAVETRDETGHEERPVRAGGDAACRARARRNDLDHGSLRAGAGLIDHRARKRPSGHLECHRRPRSGRHHQREAYALPHRPSNTHVSRSPREL